MGNIDFDDTRVNDAGWLDVSTVLLGEKGSFIEIKGWARDPESGNPGKQILIVDEKKNVVSQCKTGEIRGDVAAAYANPAMGLSGWVAYVQKEVLNSQGKILRAYVLSVDGDKAYLLNGQCKIAELQAFNSNKINILENISYTPKSFIENQEISRKEVLSEYSLKSLPNWINVELTQLCNLNCVMCYRYGTGYVGHSMSDELYEKIKEKLFPFASMVSLNGGGEPLLYNNWDKVVEDVKQYNFIPQINTNCTLLNESRIKNIVDANFQVHLSIDAATDRTYRYIRGANFASVVKNIEMMRDYKVKTSNKKFEMFLIFTPQVVNLREMPKLVSLAADWGISRFVVQKFNQSVLSQELSPDNVEKLSYEMYHASINKAHEVGIDINFEFEFDRSSVGFTKQTDKISTSTITNCLQNKIKKRTCSHPFYQFYVFADGSVHPCCYSAPSMGNLLYQGFDDIWNGMQWQLLRKNFIDGQIPDYCSGCHVLDKTK